MKKILLVFMLSFVAAGFFMARPALTKMLFELAAAFAFSILGIYFIIKKAF